MYYLIALLLIALSFFVLNRFRIKGLSLSFTVFAGLFLGVIFGIILKVSGTETQINDITSYLSIVGNGYVRLLQMIVMPLILFSIINAILKLKDASSLGKISLSVIFLLIFTTAISALIGIVITNFAELDLSTFVEGSSEASRNALLAERKAALLDMGVAGMLTEFFPKNIFFDLAGMRSVSTIAVVIFSFLLGIACLMVSKKDESSSPLIERFFDITNKIVTQLVRIILALTPYGIFAIIAKTVSKTDVNAIVNLGYFVIISYIGLLLIFVVQLILVSISGTNVKSYLKSIYPVLLFAFSSRSSAGTIPLNVETQISKLKNNPGVANFSASFGATMGQNGCAGLYPAMLAIIVAPSVGIDPTNIGFILQLILIVAISSFGIAGVGGGASIAGLIVLSTLGLPTEIVGLLISVEPLIDMGRTAVNVNGAITAGTITNNLFIKEKDVSLDTAQSA